MALLSQVVTIVAADEAEFDAILARSGDYETSDIESDIGTLTIVLTVTDQAFTLDG